MNKTDVFNVQVEERGGRYYARLTNNEVAEQEGETWTKAMLNLAGHLECIADLMAIKSEEIVKALDAK